MNLIVFEIGNIHPTYDGRWLGLASVRGHRIFVICNLSVNTEGIINIEMHSHVLEEIIIASIEVNNNEKIPFNRLVELRANH